MLAGGRSSRFGSDKALADLDGRSLIARVIEQLVRRFQEVLISAADSECYGFLGVPVIADRLPGAGPLAGIECAVESARFDTVFVVACDVPVIEMSVVELLLAAAADADVAAPVFDGRHPEPLFAVYRRSALPAISRVLRHGSRGVQEVYRSVRCRTVEIPDAGWYTNLNTEREYRRFLDEPGNGRFIPCRPFDPRAVEDL